jgi:hypothetical protein
VLLNRIETSVALGYALGYEPLEVRILAKLFHRLLVADTAKILCFPVQLQQIVKEGASCLRSLDEDRRFVGRPSRRCAGGREKIDQSHAGVPVAGRYVPGLVRDYRA